MNASALGERKDIANRKENLSRFEQDKQFKKSNFLQTQILMLQVELSLVLFSGGSLKLSNSVICIESAL